MTMLGAYKHGVSINIDEVLKNHSKLVKRIAYHLMGRLPVTVQVDDLIQAGMIALMNAATKYDAVHGAKFETYASIKIRGAMIDEVRSYEWVPRTTLRRLKVLHEALKKVEDKLGREAKDHEIAGEIGIDLEEYHKLLQEIQGQRILNVDNLLSGDHADDIKNITDYSSPLGSMEKEELHQNLVDQINNLPEREKQILSLYYNDELNLREIGKILGIGESRVCQIHSQALLRLKARLMNY